MNAFNKYATANRTKDSLKQSIVRIVGVKGSSNNNLNEVFKTDKSIHSGKGSMQILALHGRNLAPVSMPGKGDMSTQMAQDVTQDISQVVEVAGSQSPDLEPKI